MKRGKSRPARWREAVERGQSALGALREAVEDLKSLQEEYAEWQSSLPENLQYSATAEKLTAIENLDLEPDLDSVEGVLDEADGVDLPLGFGRD